MSIVLRPALAPSAFFGLSFVAALAIRQELAARLPSRDVMLKWPNDVLVGGGKICGLLLEARGDTIVIGTGVNIAPVPTIAGARLPATSVYEQAVHEDGVLDVTPSDLASDYGWNLLSRVDAYVETGFDGVRLEWLRHCAHIGGQMRVSTDTGTIEGGFVDLDMDGALVLRDGDDRHRRITTGDVELMGRP